MVTMLPSTLSVERIEAEPERIAGGGRDVDGEKVWVLWDGDDLSVYSTCLYPWCPLRGWHAHRLPKDPRSTTQDAMVTANV
jgi:hypothetical protein